MTYAFAAAGTGGHVYPALAVAEELVRRGTDRSDIVFFGGDRLEATAVPGAGFTFERVPLRGLKRSLSWDNLTLPGVVARATRQIRESLRRHRCSALLAMGGYVTVPAGWAARRQGIPVLLHEQNAVPGLANRMMSRWANESLCAFPAAQDRLRRARVVGNPLREMFAGFDREGARAAGRQAYGLSPDDVVVGVMGGSLGAASLNEVAASMAGSGEHSIVHLAGPTHAADMTRRAAEAPVRWIVIPFEDFMPQFYAACDLVLARAGAITVSELAATGTPSVLVPLAAVAQEGNAAYLAERGAAAVISQADISTVPGRVRDLLADPGRLRQMSDAARGAARLDATILVADALAEAAR